MEGPEDYCLHEHPLIYNDDQQEDWCCSACGLPLLLSPSYRCDHDCNFFLHKACKQLPQELEYAATSNAKYSLSLALKPPNEAWTCDVCGKLCENLIAYHSTRCLDKSSIKYKYFYSEIVHVDALCAFPLEIKSKHDSHKHELVAIRREAQLLCDICKRQHKGFFFSCREYSCDFWIHKDCAAAPRVIEINSHDHLLIFSYSIFGTLYWDNGHPTCRICNEKFTRPAANYSCELCGVGRPIVHLNCGISNIKNPGYDPPIQFPLEEADKSLFIYKMLNKKKIVEKNNDEDEKSSIEKYHNHPLILHDFVDRDSSSNSLCDACILPINSPPYYSCEKPGCDFLLHQHCTNLPSAIDLGFVGPRRELFTKQNPDELSSFFVSVFHNHVCNGFAYHLDSTKTDLECCSAPNTIKHQLHHTQHILYHMLMTKSGPCACCSWQSAYSYLNNVYKCASCNYVIHSRCAFLPAKVSHKFDKHPLQLSSGTNVNSEYSFCEICEGHVDTKYWFYHCKECDQFFHVNCLPSVGVLSKVKFGSSFVIPCHHEDHSVTLTRMLEIGNQWCWECKDVILGFVDDMAFQCLECCYWFHVRCALPRLATMLRLNSGFPWYY